MITLIIGQNNPESFDVFLETDLGHPIQGFPGTVSLSSSSCLILQYFIGYSSAKHNTKKYLNSIHQCFHRYRSEYNDKKLLVHCHNWSSGIGRVLISDIIRITQPSLIIEYYEKNPQIELIYSENSSFLDGVYHKTHAEFRSFQVSEQKSCDFKAFRSRLIAKYFGVVNDFAANIASLQPRVCFINDVLVKLNGKEIEQKFIKGIVGKIAGMSKKNCEECLGIGIVRDFDQENGMIYVVSPLNDLSWVDCLEIYCGDSCITLEKQDIWSESLRENVEFDIPYACTAVILSEKIQKYHPSRNFKK